MLCSVATAQCPVECTTSYWNRYTNVHITEEVGTYRRRIGTSENYNTNRNKKNKHWRITSTCNVFCRVQKNDKTIRQHYHRQALTGGRLVFRLFINFNVHGKRNKKSINNKLLRG